MFYGGHGFKRRDQSFKKPHHPDGRRLMPAELAEAAAAMGLPVSSNRYEPKRQKVVTSGRSPTKKPWRLKQSCARQGCPSIYGTNDRLKRTSRLPPWQTNQRRFPPPWRADKIPGGYVVRDANGQAIAYVYSRATETEALQASGGDSGFMNP